MKPTVFCGECGGLKPILLSQRDQSGNYDAKQYAPYGATVYRALLACEHFVTYIGRA